MIPLALFALAGCLAVDAGAVRIDAGDLARAIPAFAAAPPDAEAALAPAAGVARVFTAPELARLAAAWRLPPPPGAAVCFERPVAAPDPAKLLAAMRKTLPKARIEILDYSREPQPEGEIEFPLAGLQPGAAATMWLGTVHYASTRRFAIWARVKVAATTALVLAAADLHPGQAIAAKAVRAETRDGLPSAAPFATSVDEVIGKWPRVAMRAGSPIRLDQLEPAKEVLRGEMVQVEVRSGALRMEAKGQAEASGALDEIIPVLNTSSKKRFLARIEGKGMVSVDPSAARALP
jgi:flagella basal body P-ring formation protein FlgA